MAKDIFDILDTALKIGLGAAIGGVSSYIMTGKLFKQDMQKTKYEDRSLLLKSIANDFKCANMSTHNVVNSINLYIHNELQDINKLRSDVSEELVNCTDHIDSAKSSSNLLGLEQLFLSLEKYSEIIINLADTSYAFENTDEEIDAINEKMDKADELEDEIYPLITRAYNEM